MFAPRARLDENALVSQTPGPSMGRGRNDSPLKARGNMTTVGKLKQQNGQIGELGSPRKLFKGALGPSEGSSTPGPSSKRPSKLAPKTPGGAGPSGLRSALGDKTNNGMSKTPFGPPSRQLGNGKQKASEGSSSPVKPNKMSAPPPQTPAVNQPFGDKSYATMPSAVKSSKAPPASFFQTPAANVGKRGLMKQRMGELMDAQRMASGGMDLEPEEQVEAVPHWTDGLTEDELYPEIEYMPPTAIQEDDLHPYFDSVPRAKDLCIANPNFAAPGCREKYTPTEPELLPMSGFEEPTIAADKEMLQKSIDEEPDTGPYAELQLPLVKPSVRSQSTASSSTRPLLNGRTTSVSSSRGVSPLKKPSTSSAASNRVNGLSSRPTASASTSQRLTPSSMRPPIRPISNASRPASTASRTLPSAIRPEATSNGSTTSVPRVRGTGTPSASLSSSVRSHPVDMRASISATSRNGSKEGVTPAPRDPLQFDEDVLGRLAQEEMSREEIEIELLDVGELALDV